MSTYRELNRNLVEDIENLHKIIENQDKKITEINAKLEHKFDFDIIQINLQQKDEINKLKSELENSNQNFSELCKKAEMWVVQKHQLMRGEEISEIAYESLEEVMDELKTKILTLYQNSEETHEDYGDSIHNFQTNYTYLSISKREWDKIFDEDFLKKIRE